MWCVVFRIGSWCDGGTAYIVDERRRGGNRQNNRAPFRKPEKNRAQALTYPKEAIKLSKNKIFTEMLRFIRMKFRMFTENYKTAVKNGASVAGKDIKKAVEDRDQPFEEIVWKSFEAFKKGVLFAAKQLVDFGAEEVDPMKEKFNKNKRH